MQTLRVDWFTVVADLERIGVTMRSQAISAEVSLGTIYYWKAGGEPKYRNGQLLLDLYMHQVGKEPPTLASSVRTSMAYPGQRFAMQSTMTST